MTRWVHSLGLYYNISFQPSHDDMPILTIQKAAAFTTKINRSQFYNNDIRWEYAWNFAEFESCLVHSARGTSAEPSLIHIEP